VDLDAETPAPRTRYWKWIGLNDEVWGVFRLNGHIFQKFKNDAWQQSDYLERACQDPDFIEIDEDEVQELIHSLSDHG
jgi:hypothetical protein